MGQLEKAREAYTRAIELDPSHSAPNIKKGHINSFLGDFEQARIDASIRNEFGETLVDQPTPTAGGITLIFVPGG